MKRKVNVVAAIRSDTCNMPRPIILSFKEFELEQLTRCSDITPKVEMWHVRTTTEGNVECIRGMYPVAPFDYVGVGIA